MPWDWPVECNYHEASAYCRYISEKTKKPFRLPREEEYQLIIRNCEERDETSLDISLVPTPNSSNVALRKYSSSCPIDELSSTTLFKKQIYDLLGNVWQHSRTTIYPFNGFRVHSAYDDFTIPTLNDHHNLILGASWISMGNESSYLSRYAFRRHFYQFAGFRLFLDDEAVDSPNDDKCTAILPDFDAMNSGNYRSKKSEHHSSDLIENPYETDSLVSQYLDFHYQSPRNYFGTGFKDIHNFPELMADISVAILSKFNVSERENHWRIMDLGGAVGRSTFEFAKYAQVSQVVGVDFSARFIRAGHQLKQQKRLRYSRVIQGEILAYEEVAFNNESIPLNGKATGAWVKSNFQLNALPDIEIDLPKILQKCEFLQGDACNLSQTNTLLTKTFDCILAANLVDRLYDPVKFLEVIGTRLSPGGFLILTSPYTWLSDYTERERWLGGRKVNGENLFSLDAIYQILSKNDFSPVPIFSPHQSSPRKRRRSSLTNSNHLLVPEGNYANAFSLPFVIRETERKYQCSYAQVSVWQKKK
jgi:SAM-dependent methyltransferase